MYGDLEKQQYERLYFESEVPLGDVRKGLMRKFVWLALLLVIGFVILGATLKIPNQIQLNSVVKNRSQEEVYRFAEKVYIQEVFAHAGDSLTPNQPMVRITSPEIVDLITDHLEAQRNLEFFQTFERKSLEVQKELNAGTVRTLEAESRQARKEIQLIAQKWSADSTTLVFEKELAQKNFETQSALFKEGVIAKIELDQYEQAKVRATNAFEAGLTTYANANSTLLFGLQKSNIELQQARETLFKLDIDIENRETALTRAAALTAERIEHNYGQAKINEGSLILQAKGAGVLSYLFSGEKEVPQGSILLKTISGPAAYYVEGIIEPREIGKVHAGQALNVKLETFPHYEWGVLRGTIDQLSLTPDETGQYFFQAAITDAGRIEPHLRIGMTGESSLVVEEKTVFGYVFRNMKRVVSEVGE